MPMLLFPTGLYHGSHNINGVLEAFPQYKWKVQDQSGCLAFAVCDDNQVTGEIYVMVCLINARAPEHEHIAGGPYGETIFGLGGFLHDVDDQGNEAILGPGDFLIHAGGTVHSPYAHGFWLGAYHQPRGSRML